MTGQDPGAPDWLTAFSEAQRSFGRSWLELAGAALDPTAAARLWAAPAAAPGQGSDPLQQYLNACQQYFALGQALAEQMSKAGAGGDTRAFVDGLSDWHRRIEKSAVDPFAQLGRPFSGFGATGMHAEAAQRIAMLQARVAELQSRMLVHWTDIGRETIARFGERAPAAAGGATAPSLRALYDLWVECAEDVYMDRVHGEDYCRTQAELTNAANALKREQRLAVEQWARQLDLPTRSELNALIQRVRRLEEERGRTADEDE
jgi:hypothetical protein